MNFVVIEQFCWHKYFEASHYKALKMQPSFNHSSTWELRGLFIKLFLVEFGIGIFKTDQYKWEGRSWFLVIIQL